MSPGKSSQSANSEVKIRVVMQGGRKVREELVTTGQFFSEHLGRKVAGTSVRSTDLGVRSLIRSLLDLRVIVATVGKALISGLAITAFFGAMFAVVSAVKSLFVDVAEFALKTTSQLKEMHLGLQALLATTSEFALGIKKNFELAGRAAGQLREELIALDPRTLGGLKELQVATQALLATGAQGMVSSTNAAEELAGVASLLVNTVVLVTGRVNDQRQIFSEIKELMLGNVRAQNQVAQLIASQVGDLDTWLDRARKNKSLFEDIEAVLGGINEAADEFLNTMTSIETSEESLAMLIAESAYGDRVDSIIRRKRELLEYTDKNMDAIVRFKKELSGWAFIWQRIVILAGNLYATLQTMVGGAWLLFDKMTNRILDSWERIKLLSSGELPGLPTQEDGGGSLGLTRSMVFLDSIKDGVKKLSSETKQLTEDLRRSVRDTMGEIAGALFDLSNKLSDYNKDLLEPLREAIGLAEKIRDDENSFSLGTRIEAAKNAIEWKKQLYTEEANLIKLRDNELTTLEQKIEETNKKTEASYSKALFRYRMFAIKVSNEIAEANVKSGEKITDGIARQFLARIKLVKRVAAALVDLHGVNIAGYTNTLTAEERIAKAHSDAISRMNKILHILKEANVAVALRDQVEKVVLDRLNKQTEAMTKQSQLQDSLAEGRQLIRRFSLQREGVILPGDESIGFKELMGERKSRTQQLSGLRADKDTSPADIREAETLVASLESELRNLLSTANSVASVIGGALTKAVLTVTEKGGTIMDFFRNLRANLKAVGEQMMFAFGQAFANAIQNLILGTGSMKEAIGGLIIAVGNLAIALGTILILGSIFFGFGSIPIGIALIAAGAGMIALGALLGGSGPQGGALGAKPNATNQSPTFSFNQAQVDVQQGQARSNSDLVQATSSLADAHRNLESMPPGVVVKKGNTENGGLLTSVSRESGQGRQFVAQTNLAKNLRGI